MGAGLPAITGEADARHRVACIAGKPGSRNECSAFMYAR
ncbi:diguanylate cyclase [Pseudomonas plecoglossicida]|uniref:Diguanylate cyclase n=1 Tax=Pseudomonas plecoglossicida TaxID=70775 RepID=A0A2R7UJ88_PSEDL|nr:diguanylate cyclase [Pseudomonas plecoglossicida]RFQ04208.1 diguanylate cyclase [Pseudomonas putida]